MKLSFNIGGKEMSFGFGNGGQTKSVSPDVSAFLKGTDLDDNSQGAKLQNPYAQSAWVYTAVSILAQTVAQIPFRISRIGGGKAKRVRSLRGSAEPGHRQLCRRALGQDILDAGPAVDLFNSPHPTMDSQLFWEMIVTWFALRGEFFVVPLDAADNPVDLAERHPRVARLLPLDTGMFWHLVKGYQLEAWRYTGSPLLSPLPSEVLLPSEVIHSRQPNPYLYWRGLSPLAVAAVAAQTDFAGAKFQQGLWVNNADTGVIVTTDQQATPEQQAAILAALRERKRKAGTADRPLFLWGGAKVEKPTLSMMDMQFLETRKNLRQEIFGIFKVPESLAGFTSDLNDGGAGGSLDAAKMSFIESSIGSLCARLEKSMGKVVATFGDDLVGWFDIDSLPIMQAARRTRWDTAGKMFNLGVPLNDINENLDLGLPEYGWGKTGYLPFSLQVAGATEELPGENGDDEGDVVPDADDETKGTPFSRMASLLSAIRTPQTSQRSPQVDVVALWKSHIHARRATVNLFSSKVGKVLAKARAKTLAKLDEVHLEKSAGRLGEIKSLVDIIFDPHGTGAALYAELSAPLQTALQTAGDQLRSEIGQDDPWKYPPKKATEYIAARKQPIMGVGGTVRSQLNTSLEAGLQDGETHLQLADRVKAVFNNLSSSEAKRVAMTEVNMAYNTARHEAMDEAGIEYKSWLSSHGPNVRTAHALAEEQYIDAPIPLAEPFEVGGDKLMFPGDDSLGAGLDNIINCQCVQLAAIKTGEDEKSATYKVFGAGVMSFTKVSPGGQA